MHFLIEAKSLLSSPGKMIGEQYRIIGIAQAETIRHKRDLGMICTLYNFLTFLSFHWQLRLKFTESSVQPLNAMDSLRSIICYLKGRLTHRSGRKSTFGSYIATAWAWCGSVNTALESYWHTKIVLVLDLDVVFLIETLTRPSCRPHTCVTLVTSKLDAT